MLARSEIIANGANVRNTASDCLCLFNLMFAIIAILVVIASSGKQRKRWVGIAFVATILSLSQLKSLLPTSLAIPLAEKVTQLVMESANIQNTNILWFRDHQLQFRELIVYSWTPFLSLFAGWFVSIVDKRDDHNRERVN